MEFGRSLDKFIRWFYMCGLSCYPSFTGFLTKKTKKNRLLQYIPTGALIASSIIISVGTYIHLTIYRPTCKAHFMISYLSAPAITVLFCAIQAIFLPQIFARTCSQISTFERWSRKKFLIEPEAFRRHFCRRACFLLIASIMPFWPWMFRGWNHLLMTSVIIALRAIVYMVFVHAFFYVEILDYLLQCFVRYVDVQATTVGLRTNVKIVRSPNCLAQQIKIEINHWKLLHFKLWQISKSINHLFGWTILAIFLHNFLFAINYMYFAFLKTPVASLRFQILGKLTTTRL